MDQLASWHAYQSVEGRVIVDSGSQEAPEIIRSGLSKDGVSVFSVECARCATLPSLLVQVGAAFCFPSYYGTNLDAFDECFSVPDFLGNVNAVFVFSQAQLLLIEEPEHMPTIAQIIANAGHAWSQIEKANGLSYYCAFIVSDIVCPQAATVNAALATVDTTVDRIGDGPWLRR